MPYEAKTNWKYDDTVTEKDLNRIEQGLKDAHVAEYKDITLKPGVQVIEVDNDTPFNLGSIEGRTLVNLLGRNGRFVDLSKYLQDAVSAEKEGDYVKITLDGSKERGTFRTPTTARVGEGASKYLLVGVVNVGTAKSAYIELSDEVNYAISSNPVTGTEDQVAFAIFDGSKTSRGMSVYLHVTGSKGSYALYKDLRVYEITEKDANLLSLSTAEEVGEVYPYVDSIANLKNPYVISKYRNMLPPFYEWNNLNEKGGVIDQYVYSQREYSSATWTFVTVPVVPNTNYCLSFTGTNNIKMRVISGDESTILLSDISSSGIFNSGPNDTINVYVHAGVPGEIKNPIITPVKELGFFSPQSYSMWAAECQLSSDPIDGGNPDQLFMNGEGLPCLLRKWEKITLNGSLNWAAMGRYSGGIVVYVKSLPSAIRNTGYVTKFDGGILERVLQNVSITKSDQQVITDVSDQFPDACIISISDTDSGWGKDYIPTSEEIKAYFWGWRMYKGAQGNVDIPYNNEPEGRAWHPFDARFIHTDGTPSATHYVTIVPTQPTEYLQYVRYSDYRPYHLQYLNLKPIVEKIRNYETGLSLAKGWNMVEVGSGIVLREKTTPYNASPTITYINAINAGNRLKNKTIDIKFVYKNSYRDYNWRILTHTYEGERYSFASNSQDYSSSAIYYVTYRMQEPKLYTAMRGCIADNLKGVVTNICQRTNDIERRLSIAENFMVVRNVGNVWITPTLLNAWKPYNDGYQSPRYRKDEQGVVYLEGLMKGGSTTQSTNLFVLPPGFRPKGTLIFNVIGVEPEGVPRGIRVDVTAGGRVIITQNDSNYTNAYLSINNISFLAEQ
ncbi:hypothetical protein [Paenibacillus alvei]|uniref:hypothetical protein n=1 Tax=Paenibacillus alvei TaxID=44250 RepID=UPI00227FCB37|nr:hypothetical protein [Paenibacillus alvei]